MSEIITFLIRWPNSLCHYIVACVELKNIQWYQSEICHLTVHEKHEGQGLGRKLIQQATETAIQQGSRILQCTIRTGNDGSERAFLTAGFVKTCSFHNARSGNNVNVYQKSIAVVR
ncbi:GNAT family N-acetyltransferase [Shewanella putrefaciens]|nr:GNAT family N-acetyltransferase [Shewanella putrefaciens]